MRNSWFATAVAAVVAAGLRLISVGSSYDCFIDEMFYVDLAKSVRAGHVPPLFGGQPFMLHPPGYFIVEGAWQILTGVDADRFQQLYTMRLLNIVLATLTIVIIHRLVLRVAGPIPAIVAALLFAVDPYIMRQNGRVLLETSTLLFIAGGYLLLLKATQDGGRNRRIAAIGAGLMFGYAILTKDLAAMSTLVPLVVLAVVRWGISRRTLALTASASLVPYAGYAVWAFSQGLLGGLVDAKQWGFRRALGISQESGFNTKNAPPLVHELTGQFGTFAGTYLLIGLGVLAGLYLMIRSNSVPQRVLGLFSTSAAATVAYAALFGTNEEQFLYFIAVPAVCCTPVAASVIMGGERLTATRAAESGRGNGRPSRRSWIPVTAVTLLAVTLLINASAWLTTRTVPDDGQHRAFRWLDTHVTGSERIGIVARETSLQLIGSRFVAVPATTAKELSEERVRYLLTIEKVIDAGYSPYTTPVESRWYAEHATAVFVFHSRTRGDIVIWRTNNLADW